MKKTLLTILGFCALASPVMAQDEAPKFLRFIALGGMPAWEEELVEGIRKGKNPPKGSVPPNPVSMVTGESIVTFPLNLRTFTDIQKLEAATEGLILKDGKTPDSPTLLRKPIPAANLSLGVLYADPANMKWDSPKMLVLGDDAASFPSGMMRFVNVSDKLVIVRLGDDKQLRGVAPGRSLMRPLKPGKNTINVGYQDANKNQISIWKNQIPVLDKQRVQCFFYSSGAGPGKPPVKFHYVAEPMPRLPR